MIGHFHAKAITAMTGGTLHSVFDLRQEAADKLATEYGAKAYSNMEELLKRMEKLSQRFSIAAFTLVWMPLKRLLTKDASAS